MVLRNVSKPVLGKEVGVRPGPGHEADGDPWCPMAGVRWRQVGHGPFVTQPDPRAGRAEAVTLMAAVRPGFRPWRVSSFRTVVVDALRCSRSLAPGTAKRGGAVRRTPVATSRHCWSPPRKRCAPSCARVPGCGWPALARRWRRRPASRLSTARRFRRCGQPPYERWLPMPRPSSSTGSCEAGAVGRPRVARPAWHRTGHRRAGPDQLVAPRAAAVGGSVCDAGRGGTRGGLKRPSHPPPAEPGRRPPAQPGAAYHRHDPPALPPGHPDLYWPVSDFAMQIPVRLANIAGLLGWVMVGVDGWVGVGLARW